MSLHKVKRCMSTLAFSTFLQVLQPELHVRTDLKSCEQLGEFCCKPLTGASAAGEFGCVPSRLLSAQEAVHLWGGLASRGA